jgi:hypothetical protein
MRFDILGIRYTVIIENNFVLIRQLFSIVKINGGHPEKGEKGHDPRASRAACTGT